ncbi:MAG: hypothetical protein HKN67_05525, partial [Saprospiraceae bacterium]|nr:hypothetical protein [Saprospiraceae bacterium]
MRHLLKYITSTLYLILIISLGYFSQIESEKRIQEDLFVPVDQRKSITFIMGEDKTETSYYTNAREHFVLNKYEKTDFVVNSCRTLACVIEYLNHSEERGMYPWSVINIVAHGNPKTGLNLKLFDEGPKATPKR